MPDYSYNDPKGWGGNPKRGAAMGRSAIKEETESYSGRLFLCCVHLDSGGYDKNGTYFGIGGKLYWCANDSHTVDFMLRAKDRADARERVLKEYPMAKVKR
jgi:hypothetical protein